MPSRRTLTANTRERRLDVAVVGAGAAGLMAAIAAGRLARERGRPPTIAAVDGARAIGAKILISGGGRCNVTHDVVEPADFSGASTAAIRKILGRLDVGATKEFFQELGVRLVREETGKLFPETDRARTVLDALMRAARDAGAELINPWRVETIVRAESGFVLTGAPGRIVARRVVIATGGQSVPKTGSDGHGYELARALGHTTSPLFPALVPLLLPRGSALEGLSGVAAPCRLTVRGTTGTKLAQVDGPALCTHFGLSGPAVLDVSRHYLAARRVDPGAHLEASWLPGTTPETTADALAREGSATAPSWLRARLPERLADALIRFSKVDARAPLARMTREARTALSTTVCAMRLPVAGDRGFGYAEVTAGGVPLSEVRLDTLESRVAPGLHLCGEILDVDGPIGGFNFQWAWASGHVAGEGAVRGLGAA